MVSAGLPSIGTKARITPIPPKTTASGIFIRKSRGKEKKIHADASADELSDQDWQFWSWNSRPVNSGGVGIVKDEIPMSREPSIDIVQGESPNKEKQINTKSA